jgi:lysozyme
MSTWKQKTIWQLIKDDGTPTVGWVKCGDFWYCLDSAGLMYQSQWYQDINNGKWYYLDDNGRMLTGWQKIDSKQYCFATDGSLYVNCTTPDGYVVDGNGVWNEPSDSLVSEDCILFVKGYEAFFSYKYDDGTGVITQGYGCIGDEIADWGDTITEQQASDRLKELINNNYAKPIKSDLDAKGISLSQSQQDSLYSMSYNIGVSSLLNSSAYKYILSGGRDANTIKTYFCMWNRAGGNVMSGLTKRRVAESNIFNYGKYDSTH